MIVGSRCKRGSPGGGDRSLSGECQAAEEEGEGEGEGDGDFIRVDMAKMT